MNSSQWDSETRDLEISQRYESIGYTIEDADTNYIESMRKKSKIIFMNLQEDQIKMIQN